MTTPFPRDAPPRNPWRTGLAKSNVLRYFESREAVLLDSTWQGWLADLAAKLSAAVDADASLAERVDQLAAALAASLAAWTIQKSYVETAQNASTNHSVVGLLRKPQHPGLVRF